jgi:hypothetical protein
MYIQIIIFKYKVKRVVTTTVEQVQSVNNNQPESAKISYTGLTVYPILDWSLHFKIIINHRGLNARHILHPQLYLKRNSLQICLLNIRSLMLIVSLCNFIKKKYY